MGLLDRLMARTAPPLPPLPAVPDRTSGGSAGRRESWYVSGPRDLDRYITAPGVMPPLHLVAYHDRERNEHLLRLCEDATGLLLGPTERAVGRAGIYVSQAQGEKFYEAACTAGEFSPGTPVRLVREPGNEHDRDAVAIHDAQRDGVAAYLDHTRAKAVAPLLDAGQPLAAASLRGTPAGKPCPQIAVIVARPEVLAHLLSPRPAHLPVPPFLS